MARLTGDKEIVSVLSPKRSLATCKRDLIQSIRHGIVDQALWNSYMESVQCQSENYLEGTQELFSSYGDHS
jgi:hypothetical protein